MVRQLEIRPLPPTDRTRPERIGAIEWPSQTVRTQRRYFNRLYFSVSLLRFAGLSTSLEAATLMSSFEISR